MRIEREEIYVAGHSDAESVTGVGKSDLEGNRLKDAITGEAVSIAEAREQYNAQSFEAALMMPDRAQKMCESLFAYLAASESPEQKTIIFARVTYMPTRWRAR